MSHLSDEVQTQGSDTPCLHRTITHGVSMHVMCETLRATSPIHATKPAICRVFPPLFGPVLCHVWCTQYTIRTASMLPHLTTRSNTSASMQPASWFLFVFGATAPSGTGPPHSRGF